MSSDVRFDLDPLIERCLRIVERHRLGDVGRYARFTGETTPNPYGCADAANILYTLGRFPRDPGERARWVEALQSLQEPASGFFVESTHHEIHTTAHCIAALELFDAGPRHPVGALEPLCEPEALIGFLEALDWENPWLESHRGAGVYAALVLTEAVTAAWQDTYFEWLARECDPTTGFWRSGAVAPLPRGDASIFPHLAGSFHYLFNHEYARRPLPNPAAMVDTCLEIWTRDLFPLGQHVWFADVDWVYCLTRAVRQSGHRFGEARRALAGLAERYVPFLMSLDPDVDEGLNDLHRLFGTLCALAELQQALPGILRSRRPLRLVLDRRPFV